MALVLVGCGSETSNKSPTTPSSTAEAGPALPPRPAELRLDGLDPCALLSDDQRRRLGVNRGLNIGKSYGGPLQGPVCAWTNTPNHPDNTYAGGTILNHGAEYALGLEPTRSVDGFAATTTGSTGSDPAYYCLILVDVAPGQSLSAAYSNIAKDYPGMNHQMACDQAQQLAGELLSTLRSTKRR
jgi:hypothetical protein